MTRRILRDDQWKRIEQMLPGKSSDSGRTGVDNRLFVKAVLWVARTGSPEQALGRSRGGLTTQIHAVVEGLGHLARWTLTAGQTHDVTQAQTLIEGITTQAFVWLVNVNRP